MCNNKYLILISFLFILFSCKNESETIFTETNITTQNNTIVEVNIPQASGNEAVANQINSEINKAIISALHIGYPDEITSTSIEESIALFTEEFKAFKTDFPETGEQWEAQIDGEVMYQSPKLTTIAITSYINTGGAHGNLIISFLNFNSETGQLLKNSDLFNNMEGFKTLSKSYFTTATIDKSLLLDIDSFKLPQNIGYSEDGVILLYNTYEIAPYSSGIIEFAVPFKAAEPYLVFNSSY
ncbi:DUF3298 and DUF4163 domain-containing protein [Algibacter sp. AS12]|uniref:DUF3298 and DUF4163 domain-containing protein n=1 Tax=Algibacter sp. AS12 TaxID=3135773 RepID=UPI00398AA0A5